MNIHSKTKIQPANDVNIPFSLFLKQDDGRVFEDKHGEFWFEFCNGSLFCVTKYEGFEDKHYICLHSNSLNLYHQGMKLKY